MALILSKKWAPLFGMSALKQAPVTRNETLWSEAEQRLMEQRSETPQGLRPEEACGAGAFPKKVTSATRTK